MSQTLSLHESDVAHEESSYGNIFQIIELISFFFENGNFFSITNPLNELSILIQPTIKDSLETIQTPLIEKLQELLLKLLQMLLDKEIEENSSKYTETMHLLDSLLLYFQILCQNSSFSSAFLESNFLNALTPFLVLQNNSIFRNILKIFTIFAFSDIKAFEYFLFQIVPSIISFFQQIFQSGDDLQTTKLLFIDFFDICLTKRFGPINENIITEIFDNVLNLDTLILSTYKDKHDFLKQIIPKIAKTLSSLLFVLDPQNLTEQLISNGILVNFNQHLSNPSFSNCWNSILRLNTNILCFIHSDSPFWDNIIETYDIERIFSIFLEQPFEDYSQEALKLLNNIIVDIPEIAEQIPNDFIEIVNSCIQKSLFTSEQNKNVFRLCFSIIYQGNDEFSLCFLENLLPYVGDILYDSQDLQIYFIHAICSFLQRQMIENNTSTPQYIETIAENIGDDLIEWSDNLEEAVELIEIIHSYQK